MRDNISIEGDKNWIVESLIDDSCMAVMESVNPTICYVAFILEYEKGSGRILGSFCEQSSVACSYRGELLGLLGIHLIVLGIALANEGIHCKVEIARQLYGPSNCFHQLQFKNRLS